MAPMTANPSSPYAAMPERSAAPTKTIAAIIPTKTSTVHITANTTPIKSDATSS